MDKPKTSWLTQADMAASCRKSLSAFQKWNIEPVEKIGRNVFYMAADVLENRLNDFESRLQKHAPLDAAELIQAEREEKLLLTKAQREGQELKNSQLRKELAPVSVIEWVIGKTGGQISAILDALPLQIKKRCPKLTASGIEVIRREIVKAQNAAAAMTLDLDEYYEGDTAGDR